jgi:hypothetical protein
MGDSYQRRVAQVEFLENALREVCAERDSLFKALNTLVERVEKAKESSPSGDKGNKVDQDVPLGPVEEKLKSGALDIEGALDSMAASGVITTKQLEAFFASHGIDVGSMDTHSGSTAGALSYAKSKNTVQGAVSDAFRGGNRR